MLCEDDGGYGDDGDKDGVIKVKCDWMIFFLFGYSIDRMRRSERNAAAKGGVVESDSKTFTQSTKAKLDSVSTTASATAPLKKSRQSDSQSQSSLPKEIQEIIQARQTITVNGISLWYEGEQPEPRPLFDYLTSVDISDKNQSEAYTTRVQAYELVYPSSHRVWFNINYLIQAMQAFMMPSSFTPSSDKTFIVNFGGAGTGKSNGLYALGQHVDCRNTFILDPDRFYEFFATFLGYLPLNDPTKAKADYQRIWEGIRSGFRDYEIVIPPSEIVAGNSRRIAENCKVKAVCMSSYREMLTAVMYEVFKMALGFPHDAFGIIDEMSAPASPEKFIQKLQELQPSVSPAELLGMNIVFDSTGAMLDVIQLYIPLAVMLGYKIVFVGVYSTLKNCAARVLPPPPTKVTAASAEVAAEVDPEVAAKAAVEAQADSWNPERPIRRSDVVTSTDMPVKCRNTEQHRKTEYGGLKGTWMGMLGKKVNDMLTYPLHNNYRLILVENNFNPVKRIGGAGIIYDSGTKDIPQFIERKEKNCCLFRSDGFYGVRKGELDAMIAARAGAAADQGGYSRKRRLHTNRPRKTMKKYARRVTRRRCHGRGRSHGRRSHTRHNRR